MASADPKDITEEMDVEFCDFHDNKEPKEHLNQGHMDVGVWQSIRTDPRHTLITTGARSSTPCFLG